MFLIIIIHKKNNLQTLERLKTLSKITVKYSLKVYLIIFLLIMFLMKVFFFLNVLTRIIYHIFFLQNKSKGLWEVSRMKWVGW